MCVMSEESAIYIGRKPVMSYVLAVIRAFNDLGAEAVTLKARGRAISKAVDVAELSRRSFLEDVEVSDIEIGSEQVSTPEGGSRGVSTIAITLKKKA